MKVVPVTDGELRYLGLRQAVVTDDPDETEGLVAAFVCKEDAELFLGAVRQRTEAHNAGAVKEAGGTDHDRHGS